MTVKNFGHRQGANPVPRANEVTEFAGANCVPNSIARVPFSPPFLLRRERVHTVTVNGEQFIVVPEMNANMSHLRRMSACSVTPEKCRAVSTV
jgi:hypothetical protein